MQLLPLQTVAHAGACRAGALCIHARPTCTACPLEVRGWKLLTRVCRSSMYGRMPLAWSAQGGRAGGCWSKGAAARRHAPEKQSAPQQLLLHKWERARPHAVLAPPGSSSSTTPRQPRPGPAQSPRARGPAACPAAPPASRANSPRPQRPQKGPPAGLQHGGQWGLAGGYWGRNLRVRGDSCTAVPTSQARGAPSRALAQKAARQARPGSLLHAPPGPARPPAHLPAGG